MQLDQYRIRKGLVGSDDTIGKSGGFEIGELTIVSFFPDVAGWEHVVVSRHDRTPTWEEMCYVKDLFWDPEDVVWQYHPPRSEYSNVHPFALHLWKKRGFVMPMPPSIFAKQE
jgi:hypothetical protein